MYGSSLHPQLCHIQVGKKTIQGELKLGPPFNFVRGGPRNHCPTLSWQPVNNQNEYQCLITRITNWAMPLCGCASIWAPWKEQGLTVTVWQWPKLHQAPTVTAVKAAIWKLAAVVAACLFLAKMCCGAGWFRQLCNCVALKFSGECWPWFKCQWAAWVTSCHAMSCYVMLHAVFGKTWPNSLIGKIYGQSVRKKQGSSVP